MHGWAHLPKYATSTYPVVLLIAGATGFKEEVNEYARMLVERAHGCAEYGYPGQGLPCISTVAAWMWTLKSAHQVMLDFIENDLTTGQKQDWYSGASSTGGYYVARTAATIPA